MRKSDPNVQAFIRKCVRRWKIVQLWNCLWSLLPGTLFVATFLALSRLFLSPPAISWVVLGSVFAALFLLLSARHLKQAHFAREAVRLVDGHLRLKDRLTTSLQVMTSDNIEKQWSQLVLADCAAHLPNDETIRSSLSFSVPRRRLVQTILLLLVTVVSLKVTAIREHKLSPSNEFRAKVQAETNSILRLQKDLSPGPQAREVIAKISRFSRELDNMSRSEPLELHAQSLTSHIRTFLEHFGQPHHPRETNGSLPESHDTSLKQDSETTGDSRESASDNHLLSETLMAFEGFHQWLRIQNELAQNGHPWFNEGDEEFPPPADVIESTQAGNSHFTTIAERSVPWEDIPLSQQRLVKRYFSDKSKAQ